MDNGLQSRAELCKKGERIFSKILSDIKHLTGERQYKYILSNATEIQITDEKIEVYAVKYCEYTEISTFTNFFKDRKNARNAIYSYLLESDYVYEEFEKNLSDNRKQSIFKITPSII